MENINNYSIVFVTTDSFDNARNIAKIIVSEKIAACCSIVHNVLSIYQWDDTIKESMEYLLIIKTKNVNLNMLETRILEIHNYKVPEIISIPFESVSIPYLKWMEDVLT